MTRISTCLGHKNVVIINEGALFCPENSTEEVLNNLVHNYKCKIFKNKQELKLSPLKFYYSKM